MKSDKIKEGSLRKVMVKAGRWEPMEIIIIITIININIEPDWVLGSRLKSRSCFSFGIANKESGTQNNFCYRKMAKQRVEEGMSVCTW